MNSDFTTVGGALVLGAALGAVALLALRVIRAGRVQSAGPAFTLRPVANVCTAGSCPTVYESDGRLFVQGYTVTAAQAGVDLPEGESLVEVPLDLLKEALQKLS